MTNNRQEAITLLERFKELLQVWEYGDATSQIRSELNRNIPAARSLVIKAGVYKSFTIAPPPAIGGLVMRNVDPFTCIFDAPYGVSIAYSIIDSIDEAIGVIMANESFFDEPELKTIVSKKRKNVSNRVFVVHGRDNEVKETTARFLEKLGLVPIILHEQTNQGKTIIEKFEDYADVNFAIVLMTPDDSCSQADNQSVRSYRARQNVIFELGYFIGKLGRKNVAAIIKGDVEIPTDISGVVYTGMDNSGAWKMLLAKEIKEAGFDVDLNRLM